MATSIGGIWSPGVELSTPDLAGDCNRESAQGVLPARIDEDSPANKHGLKRGTVLLAMDGKSANSGGRVRTILALPIPNSEIDLKVIRYGESLCLQVPLGRIIHSEGGRLASQDVIEKPGFIDQDVTDDCSEQLGYNDLDGVMIAIV